MHEDKISAARPTVSGERQYHIRCRAGEIGRYMFLPGDPDRVPKIAGFGTQPEKLLSIENTESGQGHWMA